MFSENLAQLRQCFLGTVFFVAGDKDDVFSFAWAVETVVYYPGFISMSGVEAYQQRCQCLKIPPEIHGFPHLFRRELMSVLEQRSQKLAARGYQMIFRIGPAPSTPTSF
jgi:hypothetical protein